MFDIGWTEILVIAVVAIVVVGPKDLPRVLRTIAQTVGKVRRMAGEFQNTFNEALKEAELDDLKRDVQKIRDATNFKDFKSSLDPIRHLDDEFRKEMSGSALKTGGSAAPRPDAAGSAVEAMTGQSDAEMLGLVPAAEKTPPAAETAIKSEPASEADASETAGKDGGAKGSGGEAA